MAQQLGKGAEAYVFLAIPNSVRPGIRFADVHLQLEVSS